MGRDPSQPETPTTGVRAKEHSGEGHVGEAPVSLRLSFYEAKEYPGRKVTWKRGPSPAGGLGYRSKKPVLRKSQTRPSPAEGLQLYRRSKS